MVVAEFSLVGRETFMRLAIVVNSFPKLSETFIVNKVMGLRATGIEVTVLAQNSHNDRSLFKRELLGIPLDFIHYSLISKPIPRIIFDLSNLLRSKETRRLWSLAVSRYGMGRRAFKAWLMALPLALRQYDLIHFEYSGLAVAYMDSLPLLSPAKLLTSCRGTAERIVPRVKPERADELRQLFPLLDRIHVVSDDMKQTIESYGAPSDKIFVNHPSIDATKFQRQSPYPHKEKGPYYLLSVGRLHWAKGIEYALLAVRHLLDQGYDIYYDVIGGGDELDRLLFAVYDLGLSERVRLHGRQPMATVRHKLEQADIYLLPSLSEGISNAALEAMAMALPIVSTTVGGMPEVITDGVEGFLVPSRQPNAMAEKIKCFLEDNSLRQRMGQAGRQRIESVFNLQRQIGCFIYEYQTLSKYKRIKNEVIQSNP